MNAYVNASDSSFLASELFASIISHCIVFVNNTPKRLSQQLWWASLLICAVLSEMTTLRSSVKCDRKQIKNYYGLDERKRLVRKLSTSIIYAFYTRLKHIWHLAYNIEYKSYHLPAIHPIRHFVFSLSCRYPQVLVIARSCGFKSHHLHQNTSKRTPIQTAILPKVFCLIYRF